MSVVVVCILSRVQLFETPWTITCQAPLSMGFSRQEYWSGLLFPTPVDLPDPGIKSMSLKSPGLAGRLFTTWSASFPSHLSSECCQSSLLNTNQALDSSSLHLLHPPTLPWVTQALELWFRVRIRSRSLSKRLCTWVCVLSLSYTLTMEASDPTLASVADWTPTSISPLFHFSNNLCEFNRTCGYFIREFLIFQAIVMAMWPSPQICEVTYAISWIFFCKFTEYMLPIDF